MKNIKKTLNESGLAVYEELAANHVDPMECYSLGWKFKSECLILPWDSPQITIINVSINSSEPNF